MRFAYADPPYPGLARKYYGTSEVNHRILIGYLELHYPDGWALSTSADALQDVLALCPAGVRVACWVRGSRPGPSKRPRSAWEPLIVRGGRERLLSVAEVLDDALLCSINGRQPSHPGALVGMKPAAFCEWMFRQLGAVAGDVLDDVFPGSGAVGRAWRLYTSAPTPTPQLGLPGLPVASNARPIEGDTSCLAGAVRQLAEQLDGGAVRHLEGDATAGGDLDAATEASVLEVDDSEASGDASSPPLEGAATRRRPRRTTRRTAPPTGSRRESTPDAPLLAEVEGR
jgi:hypothetical protein